MARSPYLKFMDNNKLSDGLLREFIYKEKWRAALEQIEDAKYKLQYQINSLNDLKRAIETNEETV